MIRRITATGADRNSAHPDTFVQRPRGPFRAAGPTRQDQSIACPGSGPLLVFANSRFEPAHLAELPTTTRAAESRSSGLRPKARNKVGVRTASKSVELNNPPTTRGEQHWCKPVEAAAHDEVRPKCRALAQREIDVTADLQDAVAGADARIVDDIERQRVGPRRQHHDGRIGGIDLLVTRRRRHLLRQR
jgi:hypothetical protein